MNRQQQRRRQGDRHAVQHVKAIQRLLTDEPREANTEGGIFPAIFGTFVMTLLMSLAVVPFGVLAAIYLREYARQGFFVRAVRIAVNNLAGVPSIVFGLFGYGLFVIAMKFGTSLLAGWLTMARAMATRCCWPPESWAGL